MRCIPERYISLHFPQMLFGNHILPTKINSIFLLPVIIGKEMEGVFSLFLHKIPNINGYPARTMS